MQNGQTVKTFSTETIRESICKPTTLQIVRETLLGVLEGEKGTAKNVRSKYVRIFGPLGCLLTECCKCRYRAANYQQKRVNAGFLQRLFGMLPLDVRKIVPIHALNPLEGKNQSALRW